MSLLASERPIFKSVSRQARDLRDDDTTSSGSEDSAMGSYDSDCIPPAAGTLSRRDLWRQSSMVRSNWLHNQVQLTKEAIRSFDVGQEHDIPRPSWVTPGLSLTFKDVSFTIDVPSANDRSVKEKLPVLENCCGHFPAGSLVALMGPSGCGKTTMLDIMARKKTTAHTGKIYVNGQEVDRLFPRVSAYVDCTDTMPEHWTVREAVRFNFFLKGAVPVYKHFKRERIQELVDFYLESLGIAHVAGSKIGGDTVRGISSGQRRRVTLARGLACCVPLMFCDEPTSGLSSTDAETCMKVLKIVTHRWKRTVVVVIHQPRVEVARLFDKLVLLTSRPGRIVYDGPMEAAIKYWNDVGYPVPPDGNPTDHFLDTVTPDALGAQPDYFVEEFRKRLAPRIEQQVDEAARTKGVSAFEYLQAEYQSLQFFGRMPKVRHSQYAVNIKGQIQMVGMRKLRLMWRNPAIMGMQVAVPLLEGAGLGACFYDIASKEPRGLMVVSGWFNMLLMGVLFGGFTGVPQLIEDRILMQKEVAEALYSEWAHIFVTLLLDMLVTSVRNSIFATIMYAFSGLLWEHYVGFIFWILLVGITMDPIFKAAAAIASDMQTATMSGLIFVLFIAVFNGVGFVTKSSAPVFLKPLLYIMPSSRVAEQVTLALYGDDEQVWNTLHNFLGLERASPTLAILICLTWFTVFNIVAAWALMYVKKVQR